MSRTTSPYILGDHWLDKRRDGKASDIWQIAHASQRSIIYRSTHCRSLADAKGVLDALRDELKALTPQGVGDARVIPLLMAYWKEHGKTTINQDQTGRSLRTFIGFLDRKSTRLNSSHPRLSRMPSSA